MPHPERRPPPLRVGHALRIFVFHRPSLVASSPAPFHFAAADMQLPFSRRIRARVLLTTSQATLKRPPKRREAKRRKAHPSIVRATPSDVATRRCAGAAAADRGAARLRRSTAALARPDASSIGSAPDPRFLRPGLTGVTRFCLSLVYRAPRRPVVVPVGRVPRAARERFARPPAGTALAPLSGLHLESTLR